MSAFSSTPAARLAILAGLIKLVVLPLLILPLRDQAAFLAASSREPSLTPAWLAHAAASLITHLPAFVAFWMLLGFFMIAAGVRLRSHQPWARIGLQALCWFGLLEAPLVAAFIEAVRRMLLRSQVPGAEVLAASLVSRFWAALAWLVIYATLLLLLRRTGGAKTGDGADGQAEGESQGARS